MSIKEFVESQMKSESDMDIKYPDRHKTIHKAPCKQCPSTKGSDPESDDIRACISKGLIATEYLFVCAWRPNKLCKGNCDFMEIDQKFLDNLYNI